MPVITQIQSQKKNHERVSVFVDDAFFCGLTLDDLVRNNLVAGMDVTDEFLSSLLGQAGENDMYNKTLVYILKSPRTEQEIRRFLSRKKDCSSEMINRIVDRLKTMNYIDDEAYARMFVGSKHVKASARAIKHKLRSKGVNTEIVETATTDIGNQDDLAKSVAEKYMRYREYDKKNLDKLFRYLISKGFEYDIVGEIVAEYRNKKEVDSASLAEYNATRNEYFTAREQMKTAKQNLKKIRKKIVEDIK